MVSGPSNGTLDPMLTASSMEAGSTATCPSEAEKETMRNMFNEMFKGRVESAVIDMVLQEENWNGEIIT